MMARPDAPLVESLTLWMTPSAGATTDSPIAQS
jgi:hypothetical protein